MPAARALGLLAAAAVAAGGCGGTASKPAGGDPRTIRYVPLGDSYTIGEGVGRPDRWPEQLAAQLRRDGVPVRVVLNPAVSGYTSRDVLDRELPALARARADLVTLQIGVNDWVRGVGAGQYRANVAALLDAIVRQVGDPGRVVAVTSPDFATTPAGVTYTNGRDGTAGIEGFNRILADEARRRRIAVADVFTLSKRVRIDPDLVASDGLHPSAKQYAEWVTRIRPVVRRALARSGQPGVSIQR